VDREALDGLAVQAIRDTNPAFDPDALHSYSEAQWLGMVNAAKGQVLRVSGRRPPRMRARP
jgi:hypothetical protein